MLSAKSQERLGEIKDLFPELEIIHGYTDSYGKRKMVGFGDIGVYSQTCHIIESHRMSGTRTHNLSDDRH
jgi:hypothetical protein